MVRNVAQRMFDALMMDSAAMMSPACFMDFGMDSCSEQEFSERFGALQHAVRSGAKVEDLDKALGSSEKLTDFVRKYGSRVVFAPTVWDEMGPEDEFSADGEYND